MGNLKSKHKLLPQETPAQEQEVKGIQLTFFHIFFRDLVVTSMENH